MTKSSGDSESTSTTSPVDAFSKLATESKTTLVVPANMNEVGGLIASAMRMVQAGKLPA